VPNPKILYGTAWKKATTATCVAAALRQGFRGIDTACQPRHYDEAGVGAGIAQCLDATLSRSDLYLQSKFTPLAGQDPARLPYDPQASLPEQIRQSCATSLHNLQTTYLDCLVLHSPLDNHTLTMTAWQALQAAVTAGNVHRLGISNCYELATLQRLHRDADIKPAVLQNRFYATTGYDRELRAFCLEHGMVYQSFWTLTANPQLLAHSAVRSAAQHYGRSAAQVLFRYLTQQGIVPLTGTTSTQHMKEDLEIFDFTLAPDECTAIASALRPGVQA